MRFLEDFIDFIDFWVIKENVNFTSEGLIIAQFPAAIAPTRGTRTNWIG